MSVKKLVTVEDNDPKDELPRPMKFDIYKPLD